MTVARLPPAAKLSLVERKNIRDRWEAEKPELEKELQALLDPEWTFDIDPKLTAPYTPGTDYEGRIGDVIKGYAEDAVFSLKNFVYNYKEDGKKELNTVVPKKTIGFDVDESGKYSYCGPIVRDGGLVIVFKPGQLWVNASDGLEQQALIKALSEASETAGGGAPKMGTKTKLNISQLYDVKIPQVQEDIGRLVQMPDIRLNPNFDTVYAALAAEHAKKPLPRADWEGRLGAIALEYFRGLLTCLEWKKVGSDELLREAFAEAIEKKEVRLRVVETTKSKNTGQCAIADGILYLDFTPQNLYSNTNNVAANIVDALSDAV